MNKKRSRVVLPVTGYLCVMVEHEEGDTKQRIISEALAKADFSITTDNPDVVECGEFETHRAVTTGNVCHAVLNNAYIYSTEDAED